MTNSDPESSRTLSHSPKPRMKIIVLLVDNPPMYIYIYISIGPLDEYIKYSLQTYYFLSISNVFMSNKCPNALNVHIYD